MAAEQLINLIIEAGLELTLPAGIITWEARGSSSIIDLVFMTPMLISRLEYCQVKEDLC